MRKDIIVETTKPPFVSSAGQLLINHLNCEFAGDQLMNIVPASSLPGMHQFSIFDQVGSVAKQIAVSDLRGSL